MMRGTRSADDPLVLIREDVVTRATPERAWELVSDPALHELWNPRIVRTEASGSGPPGKGYRYRVTFEMSGRRTEMDAEITEFSPPLRFAARLEERFKADGKDWQRFYDESYVITPHRDATHVRHDVRVHHSGVNLFWRFVIWLISRTGRPQEQPFMERFGELAAGDAPRPAASA
jgi:uncharacterized protein YndB with AHSA1/START domain